MTQLLEEKHPREGRMSLVQLRTLVAPILKEQAKARSQSQRDQSKERVRAQMFWFDIQHTERMQLPSLEKQLREAVEANKVYMTVE
jgi:hypothetical protein